MENNAQKTALTASLKAEEKKVMAKRPLSTGKKTTPKPTRTKTAIVTKTLKKTATPQHTEKKQHKQKTIRDSFTMPENEYSLIATLKKKCLAAGVAVKKSELLRAGLQSLAEMSQVALKKQLSKLDEIKTGRPANTSKEKLI
jgi:hypothetical protein